MSLCVLALAPRTDCNLQKPSSARARACSLARDDTTRARVIRTRQLITVAKHIPMPERLAPCLRAPWLSRPGFEGGRRGANPQLRCRMGAAGRSGECVESRSYADSHDRASGRRYAFHLGGQHAHGPNRHACRPCRRGDFSCFSRVGVHDRARIGRGWRLYAVVGPRTTEASRPMGAEHGIRHSMSEARCRCDPHGPQASSGQRAILASCTADQAWALN